ncbi:MAG: transposase domain-containing protein [Planctomycetes bacterium]|nr:transposase domain-containing protein [Planctomycetota bacterium]
MVAELKRLAQVCRAGRLRSIRGGKNAAIFYSVIGTCKLLGIPPFEYLRDVLSRISTHPHRLIHELTPAGWKAARDAAAIKSA